MERMAPVDAQMYWMSDKIPNDQFLLYAFGGAPEQLDSAIDDVLERVRAVPDLSLRIAAVDCALDYPYWVRGDVDRDQVVVHSEGTTQWPDCLRLVAGLADDQLDPRESTWRLHLFGAVEGAPNCAAAATVAVFQVSHALGDGIRSSALARAIFSPQPPTDPVTAEAQTPYSVVHAAALAAIRFPKQIGSLGWRAIEATRTHRQLVDDVATGAVPPASAGRPLLSTNSRPEGERAIRTLVFRRDDFPGPTVTISALTAISLALSDHLRSTGEDPETLGAEVSMEKFGKPMGRNHFRNVGIGLYSGTAALEVRTGQIAEALGERQLRNSHPALRASDEAFAAIPAPLLRWGVSQFDPTVVPASVSGNTVVSSVNRGAADLRFGDRPVAFTAGYPALSPVMSVTHGVHGIGDTVAISVHASHSAIEDIDSYMDMLRASVAWNQIVRASGR
ncbi:wax ester/triacylglycerol synthase domain-containing protein [Nocardia sp. 348MFTsu5.1]|uniref:wax ester/triacylglycerol synthase domain-containing protein n=1 Tax=Nocardia sp. 348MFTsu5.1 TaxID=1172185 RepID=UPI0003814730|nr:wax ester/triacylglycerol synthase domain-containing protein [Nocardia sp. 348MFTsu5.1]